MNPTPLIGGFVPLAVFASLDGVIRVDSAAVVATTVALVVAMLTSERKIASVPVAQSVIFAAVAGLAFGGGASAQHFLATYGCCITFMLLAVFMLGTVLFVPFTATIARYCTPAQDGAQFVDADRRISAAWGLAVLIIGLADLGAATALPNGGKVLVGVLLWCGAVALAVAALGYTWRVVADVRARLVREMGVRGDAVMVG
ncbi:hypothetical protein [Nocardia macrotermitis]|uniref:Uncharacterized protein n=1 Tax=Nocardia macrotermitis TaxID=2585198 RepID=A0A7K0DA30_9NOCA|nr:hypothetical protein [Nocardia macrotermitis]MQY22469.1 hypothetical protein [Nocardia macrotermitis]